MDSACLEFIFSRDMTGAMLAGTVTFSSPMKWVYLVGTASSFVENALMLCDGRNFDRDCTLQQRRANIIIVVVQNGELEIIII